MFVSPVLLLCSPGRSAFIGIGFGDRCDAFDFNVALQDHFKYVRGWGVREGASSPLLNIFFLSRWVKQESELSKQAQAPDSTPKLDLGFKEGQTITLNIGVIIFRLN